MHIGLIFVGICDIVDTYQKNPRDNQIDCKRNEERNISNRNIIRKIQSSSIIIKNANKNQPNMHSSYVWTWSKINQRTKYNFSSSKRCKKRASNCKRAF